MYPPEIIELVKAGRAMLDGKGWHEIDGDCSICLRFKKAVEIAENTAEQSVQSDGAFTSAQILKVLDVSKEQRKRSLKRTPRR